MLYPVDAVTADILLNVFYIDRIISLPIDMFRIMPVGNVKSMQFYILFIAQLHVGKL